MRGYIEAEYWERFADGYAKMRDTGAQDTKKTIVPMTELDVLTNELPRSKLRGIKPLNPETVVVRTALARQFGGVDHGVSGGGTLCAPSHHSNGPSWRCRG